MTSDVTDDLATREPVTVTERKEQWVPTSSKPDRSKCHAVIAYSDANEESTTESRLASRSIIAVLPATATMHQEGRKVGMLYLP